MSLSAFQRRRREQAAREAMDKNKQQNKDEELQQLRERAKELGIPQASRLGEKKLLEAITAKEAELQEQAKAEKLRLLRERAIALCIENVEEKDDEALATEIAMKEAELQGDPNHGGDSDAGS
jgi:hypothetical protein